MRSSSIILCLILAACDSGGGSGSANPSSDVLGQREVPGGVVTVQRSGAAGFRISTSVAGVQGLEVMQGADYDLAQPVALSPDATGGWTGSVAVGASLLVRMTMNDGAVIETAPGDFIRP